MKFLVLFLVSAMSFISHAGESLPGTIYNFSGIHSERGQYSGELEIRKMATNKVSAVRLIKYQDYKFQGLQVEEVWTGQGEYLANGNLQINYNLQKAHHLLTAGPYSRSKADFQSSLHVTQVVSLNIPQSLVSTDAGIYQEIFIGPNMAATNIPLWVDQRQVWTAEGKSHNWATAIGAPLMRGVISDYQKDSFVRGYADRPEFKQGIQLFVFDPTDYDFYQTHPNSLRVANSVVDFISLTEALNRRNAYAYSLSDKAQYFDDEMTKFHLNELGLYCSAIVDSEGHLISRTEDGDGALWTGMYVASQAMRYEATREPAALENVKKSLQGLFLLMDVTGNSSEFARNARLLKQGERPEGEWKVGAAPYTHIAYLQGGNNDMFKGLIHAFAWAYRVIPKNDPLWPALAQHADRVKDLKVSQDKPQNKAISYGLATLYTKRADYREDYLRIYTTRNKIADWFDAGEGTYYKGIADWSGINLQMVSVITEILVAERLADEFPWKPGNFWDKLKGKIYVSERDIVNQNREILMEQWNTYAEARRDFVTVSAYTMAYKEGTRSFGYSEKRRSKEEAERTWSVREKWDRTLARSVWSLRETPLYLATDVSYDLSLTPSWVASPWPRLPWKSFKKRQPMSYHYQGIYGYPLFETTALGSNFMWKDNPFSYQGSGAANNRQARTDYLYVYWMGRKGGLFK